MVGQLRCRNHLSCVTHLYALSFIQHNEIQNAEGSDTTIDEQRF